MHAGLEFVATDPHFDGVHGQRGHSERHQDSSGSSPEDDWHWPWCRLVAECIPECYYILLQACSDFRSDHD
jgi:hypothetical protein